MSSILPNYNAADVTNMVSPRPIEIGENPIFDFKTGEFVTMSAGILATAKGKDSVVQRCIKALSVPRYTHPIYARTYGEEISSMIGSSLPDDIVTSEIQRRLSDALSFDEGILSVKVTGLEITGDQVTVTFEVVTVYDERALPVQLTLGGVR